MTSSKPQKIFQAFDAAATSYAWESIREFIISWDINTDKFVAQQLGVDRSTITKFREGKTKSSCKTIIGLLRGNRGFSMDATFCSPKAAVCGYQAALQTKQAGARRVISFSHLTVLYSWEKANFSTDERELNDALRKVQSRKISPEIRALSTPSTKSHEPSEIHSLIAELGTSWKLCQNALKECGCLWPVRVLWGVPKEPRGYDAT